MKKGFTLIEVTIALAIFALASVALTQSFLSGMFSLENFKFDDAQENSLMFVFSQVLSIKERPTLEKGGSIQTIESGNVKWNAKITKTSILDLYKLNINVMFDDKESTKKHQTFHEEFYVYKPEWAESGERQEILRSKKEKREDKNAR